MNPLPDDADPIPDAVLDQLEAYDEALAAGTPPILDLRTESEAFDDLHSARACLDLLARHWRRGGASTSHEPARDDSTKGRADAGLPPLKQVGRFQIVRELGRGGCGIVFLATDPLLQRQVAVKMPRPESLLTAEHRQRFIQEAKVAASLDHPNIVPVHEAGEDGVICYIAFAYCPGLTLREWLKQRDDPVPVRQAAEILAILAEAVQHTHSRGILHRDLKPGNILVVSGSAASEEQRPTDVGLSWPFTLKITDFGLAKILQDDCGLTHTRRHFGYSPIYGPRTGPRP